MADNVAITLGSGTGVIAADEIAGVKHQRVKIQYGADGSATDVSAAQPLPVAISGDAATPLTNTQLRATPVSVTTDSRVVSVSGPVTDTQLRATPVPVTGALTDTQLRATPVPISLGAATFPVVGPVTDTQLRASDVKITLDGEEVVVIEKPIALTTLTGVISSTGDNTIIAAQGAGKRICVAELTMQLEASASTTSIVKSGTTNQRRWLFPMLGSAVSWVYDQGREIRLLDNNALVISLSGANQVGYTVRYFVENVV